MNISILGSISKITLDSMTKINTGKRIKYYSEVHMCKNQEEVKTHTKNGINGIV